MSKKSMGRRFRNPLYLRIEEIPGSEKLGAELERLLPVERDSPIAGDKAEPKTDAGIDYLYEQPPADILGRLLPRYVQVQLFRALAESAAAEHAARMTAMDSATNNAGELIDKITILEVLYQVGFNSKSSFNTLFKKYIGITPTEFRKKQER